MKFNLDWSIYSSKDRLNSIKEIQLNKLNQKELETVTNYILYGKDEDGTSCVDRKEIQIQTKFDSYQKDKVVSLDEMMENPAFDENLIQKENSIYKNCKVEIDKEKAKLIPGMVELWKDIDKVQNWIDENQGKKEFQKGTPKLSQKQLYYYQHYLIQIRRQQYYLMDGYYPVIQFQKNRFKFYNSKVDQQGNYPILPRGVMKEENDLSFARPRSFNFQDQHLKIYSDSEVEELQKNNKPYFDFRNEDHIYQLIQFYYDIKVMVEDQPDSILNNLLWTLDFYIEKANLSQQQRFIIDCKKERLQNKEIAEKLLKELQIYHQENYISTIWNKTIKLICAAVELNYDEFLARNYDKAWKVCNKCGREFLRDSRNFVKKAKSSDGLTSRCKWCDRELRKKKI